MALYQRPWSDTPPLLEIVEVLEGALLGRRSTGDRRCFGKVILYSSICLCPLTVQVWLRSNLTCTGRVRSRVKSLFQVVVPTGDLCHPERLLILVLFVHLLADSGLTVFCLVAWWAGR